MNNKSKSSPLKQQILAALSHAEAEDGLYFENLLIVHEAEERPIVDGSEEDVLEALAEMIAEGSIETDESGAKVVFKLRR